MAKFNYADADKYGGQGGAGYFSIKNDKDVARVRFLYNSIEDIEGYAVHEVEENGKKRYVNCLRDYNQPIDDCPFCKAHKPQYAKLFIPLWNEDEHKVQIWERGKKFFAKMSSICSRYASNTDLVQQVFEIERNGAKGDQQTTYEIYPVGQPDNSRIEDFAPDGVELLGNLILDKTPEEMEEYLNRGSFGSSSSNEAPIVRRGASNRPSANENDSWRNEERREVPSRRTPRRNEDSF